MDFCRNICSACRASLAKLRNVVTSVPGSSLFIVALIALCLTVPSFHLDPYNINTPSKQSKLGDGGIHNPAKSSKLGNGGIHNPAKSSKLGNGGATKLTNIIKSHSKDPSSVKHSAVLTNRDHSGGMKKFKGNEKIHNERLPALRKEDVVNAYLKKPKPRDHVSEKSHNPKIKDVKVPPKIHKPALPKIAIVKADLKATVIPHPKEQGDTGEGLSIREFRRSRKLDHSTDNRYLTRRGRRKYELLGRNDMLAEDRKCRQTLPEAIIIGVMKAGTEAFSTFLAINPQVAMSLNVRSTLFFTSTYSKGLSWYRQQMACKTKEQTTIEKAPQYFPNALAPQRIYKMNKHIKLILLVRNPIDRAVSHYLQVKNSHPEQVKGKSFEDIVFTRSGAVDPNNKYIYLSKYSLILKRWLKYFKLSQILILNGDEFKEHQINVLAKAESFLGIKHYITEDKFILDKEKGFYCLNVEGSPACLGSGKGREHPALSKTHYHKLRAYFRPYNAELSRIARQKFDW